MPTQSVPESVIKRAFYESTEKTHIIACWVGLLLNLVWFISDFFIINSYFQSFLLFRVGVSGGSLLLLLLRDKLGINIYYCMFILVAGISVQNAYMWSVMDLSHFEEHTFAYMVLFIGAGMLVLWEARLSLLLIAITVTSNIIFYTLNSELTLREFVINGGLMTLTVLVFSLFLIRSRYKLTYNEIKSRLALEQSKIRLEEQNMQLLDQKVEIEQQNRELEGKNREITDSITYARNIQLASVPTEERFTSCFKDSFVLYLPKDIVSGDFYWVYQQGQIVYYVTADCTGHGVPGGFMTMLGLSFLQEIITVRSIDNPAEVLDLLRDKIIHALNQNGTPGESKDGMDITVCRLDKTTLELTYASANNSVYLVRNSEMTKHVADRQPCGFYHHSVPFTKQVIQLQPGDCVYTLTDGYADQFGGPRGKKFRYKQLEEMLLQNHTLSFSQQSEKLKEALFNWQGTNEQVDDILVIGITV